jgi:FkbM family methyltransferase
MSLGKTIRKCLNFGLRPLGWQVVKSRAKPPGVTMDEALARTAGHGLEVRTILDVGASNGNWTEKALRCFPDAHVLAFEPLAEQAAALERLKAKCPRFHYVSAVVGDTVGEITFDVSDDLDGSGVYGGQSGRSRRVPMTTIDREVQRHQLTGPFLLKLDTHGFEIPILAGAAATMLQTNALVVEVYNFQVSPTGLRFHEMCGHLEQLGFRCFDLADPMLRLKDHAFWQVDLFFARQTAALFAYSKYA